jgi:hypothetical protein
MLEARASDPSEIFLGGVAGVNIGRLALANDPFNTGYGYGLYFTDNRVIGFSYRKLVSRAYRWAYLLCLTWALLLTSTVAYDRLTGVSGDQPILPGVWAVVVGGSIVGLAVLTLSFLLVITPGRAASQIRRKPPTSLPELENQSSDFMLEELASLK